jgi:hypothetical protein
MFAASMGLEEFGGVTIVSGFAIGFSQVLPEALDISWDIGQ